ncbi:hypothetical protein B0H17DRAFT_1186984 [Mycena rosella]|uniref:Uncharacterized protein n=1 Tax=Mycena rosella TaxID=1033263 RepID=A0AAD7C9T0_MYCRO|nr:hypothetical protein B0H17DRAFT_1186984 [Mycena rosella]
MLSSEFSALLALALAAMAVAGPIAPTQTVKQVSAPADDTVDAAFAPDIWPYPRNQALADDTVDAGFSPLAWPHPRNEAPADDTVDAAFNAITWHPSRNEAPADDTVDAGFSPFVWPHPRNEAPADDTVDAAFNAVTWHPSRNEAPADDTVRPPLLRPGLNGGITRDGGPDALWGRDRKCLVDECLVGIIGSCNGRSMQYVFVERESLSCSRLFVVLASEGEVHLKAVSGFNAYGSDADLSETGAGRLHFCTVGTRLPTGTERRRVGNYARTRLTSRGARRGRDRLAIVRSSSSLTRRFELSASSESRRRALAHSRPAPRRLIYPRAGPTSLARASKLHNASHHHGMPLSHASSSYSPYSHAVLCIARILHAVPAAPVPLRRLCTSSRPLPLARLHSAQPATLTARLSPPPLCRIGTWALRGVCHRWNEGLNGTLIGGRERTTEEHRHTPPTDGRFALRQIPPSLRVSPRTHTRSGIAFPAADSFRSRIRCARRTRVAEQRLENTGTHDSRAAPTPPDVCMIAFDSRRERRVAEHGRITKARTPPRAVVVRGARERGCIEERMCARALGRRVDSSTVPHRRGQLSLDASRGRRASRRAEHGGGDGGDTRVRVRVPAESEARVCRGEDADVRARRRADSSARLPAESRTRGGGARAGGGRGRMWMWMGALVDAQTAPTGVDDFHSHFFGTRTRITAIQSYPSLTLSGRITDNAVNFLAWSGSTSHSTKSTVVNQDRLTSSSPPQSQNINAITDYFARNFAALGTCGGCAPSPFSDLESVPLLRFRQHHSANFLGTATKVQNLPAEITPDTPGVNLPVEFNAWLRGVIADYPNRCTTYGGSVGGYPIM